MTVGSLPRQAATGTRDDAPRAPRVAPVPPTPVRGAPVVGRDCSYGSEHSVPNRHLTEQTGARTHMCMPGVSEPLPILTSGLLSSSASTGTCSTLSRHCPVPFLLPWRVAAQAAVGKQGRRGVYGERAHTTQTDSLARTHTKRPGTYYTRRARALAHAYQEAVAESLDVVALTNLVERPRRQHRACRAARDGR